MSRQPRAKHLPVSNRFSRQYELHVHLTGMNITCTVKQLPTIASDHIIVDQGPQG
jgi:hypothetical protein